MYIKRLWANLSLSVNKRSPRSFFLIISLPPSFFRPVFVHLPESACNQRALSSQKGHPVPLMVFWFIPSSSLHSHPSLSPPFFSHRETGEPLPPGCQEGTGPISCRLTVKEKLKRTKKQLFSPPPLFLPGVSRADILLVSAWSLFWIPGIFYLINQSWLIV